MSTNLIYNGNFSLPSITTKIAQKIVFLLIAFIYLRIPQILRCSSSHQNYPHYIQQLPKIFTEKYVFSQKSNFPLLHIPTSSSHNAPLHKIIGDILASTALSTNIIFLTNNNLISIPKIAMSNTQINPHDSSEPLIPPYPSPSITEPQTALPYINSTIMDTTNHTVNSLLTDNNNHPSNPIRKQKRNQMADEEDSEALETINHPNKYRNQDAHDSIHVYETLFNRALRCNRVSYAADLARAHRLRPPDTEDPESVGAVLDVR